MNTPIAAKTTLKPRALVRALELEPRLNQVQ
jgi:hypothetical protein